MEELQIIQSAIPHERYGANYWEMSLRMVKDDPHREHLQRPLLPHQGDPPSKMVRRVKTNKDQKNPAAATSSTGPTEGQPLNKRKKQLAKSLSNIRPHEVDEAEASPMYHLRASLRLGVQLVQGLLREGGR